MFTAAGSLSNSVDSTAMWFGASTDVHSALMNASWWSDPGAESRARSSSASPKAGQPISAAHAGSAYEVSAVCACSTSRWATPTSDSACSPLITRATKSRAFISASRVISQAADHASVRGSGSSMSAMRLSTVCSDAGSSRIEQ
ncbi:Uncharacterised protein [Mycobacteroides abscessus subsp. abscessus]|nr:Uncharacterised protein [Mycobacteroides abscessus subsp. abscessus]